MIFTAVVSFFFFEGKIHLKVCPNCISGVRGASVLWYNLQWTFIQKTSFGLWQRQCAASQLITNKNAKLHIDRSISDHLTQLNVTSTDVCACVCACACDWETRLETFIDSLILHTDTENDSVRSDALPPRINTALLTSHQMILCSDFQCV